MVSLAPRDQRKHFGRGEMVRNSDNAQLEVGGKELQGRSMVWLLVTAAITGLGAFSDSSHDLETAEEKLAGSR